MYLKSLLILLLVILLSSCESKNPKKSNFLWTISGKNNNIHLLGSIHFGSPDFYPLDSVIYKHFQESEYLVVEVDVKNINPQELKEIFFRKGTLEEGKTLKDVLNPKTLSSLKEFIKKTPLTYKMLENQKPWQIVMTITAIKAMQQGLMSQYGIEMHFLNKVENVQKIKELESIEKQFSILGSFSLEQQALYLEKSLNEDNSNFKTLARLWKRGSLDSIHSVVFSQEKESDFNKEFYEKMFYQRNETMVDSIIDYMKDDKDYFVVVGLGHLLGEKGIVEILKSKGYHIK